MIPSLKIRKAEKKDASLILQFIRELAIFEKLEHKMTGTLEDLERTLFRKNPHAEALIAEDGNEPVGFVLFFHSFSTFLCKDGLYIEDLYVKESCRGKGYGKLLIQEVCRLAVARDCGRVEWSCLDWNEKAICFYKNLGAIPMDEWTVFRLTPPAFNKIAEEN